MVTLYVKYLDDKLALRIKSKLPFPVGVQKVFHNLSFFPFLALFPVDPALPYIPSGPPTTFMFQLHQ